MIVHCGRRSGLAAGVDRLGQRRHSVVVRRASRSYQPLELLFWQQFSVSSDFDQGAERKTATYVVTKAAVGLSVLQRSHLLLPNLHFAGDERLAQEC